MVEQENSLTLKLLFLFVWGIFVVVSWWIVLGFCSPSNSQVYARSRVEKKVSIDNSLSPIPVTFAQR